MDQDLVVILIHIESRFPVLVKGVLACSTPDTMKTAEEIAVRYIEAYCPEIEINDPDVRSTFLERGFVLGKYYSISITNME